jgi:hypothetical protein
MPHTRTASSRRSTSVCYLILHQALQLFCISTVIVPVGSATSKAKILKWYAPSEINGIPDIRSSR